MVVTQLPNKWLEYAFIWVENHVRLGQFSNKALHTKGRMFWACALIRCGCDDHNDETDRDSIDSAIFNLILWLFQFVHLLTCCYFCCLINIAQNLLGFDAANAITLRYIETFALGLMAKRRISIAALLVANASISWTNFRWSAFAFRSTAMEISLEQRIF